jgi:glycosyltransferase involved in cell wall biosynthesis
LVSGGISVLILTLNEEANLSKALESSRFADRIYVIDSGSVDKTEEVARASGALFVRHHWEGFAGQKNWALTNLPIITDWVFFLDADETITPELAGELLRISNVNTASGVMGYYVNRHFIWRGKRIRHCGYYPSWNLRYFRKGKARYEDREVHEHILIDGPTQYLRGELRHEDTRGRDFIWAKHLRYAELEAKEMMKLRLADQGTRITGDLLGSPPERRRAIKEMIWPVLPARALLRFIYMYVLRGGVFDGLAGLDLCLFVSRYENEISKRYRELRNDSRRIG